MFLCVFYFFVVVLKHFERIANVNKKYYSLFLFFTRWIKHIYMKKRRTTATTKKQHDDIDTFQLQNSG